MTTEINRAFLKRLREETHQAHIAVEKTVDIPARITSPSSYTDLLERFYGFYKPVELALRVSPLRDYRDLKLSAREKQNWLKQDILALGSPLEKIAALPQCATPFIFNAIEDAIGCLYVLEGSSLGGQIISKMLRQETSITPKNGGRFFHGYGDQVSVMWRSFGDFVCRHITTPPQQDTVINAANQTFHSFRKWIQ